MAALLTALPAAVSLIQTALSVISAFKGTPETAKVTGYVQDAVSVVSALTPLVVSHASGGAIVTEADVRAALAGNHTALQSLDDQIAAKEAELKAPPKP